MIYVPDDAKPCVVVTNATTVRVYDSTPRNNFTSSYRDYYPRLGYAFTEGSQTWSASTALPRCLHRSQYTSEIYYRVDFADSLVIFIVMAYVMFWFPFKLFMRLFRKGS